MLYQMQDQSMKTAALLQQAQARQAVPGDFNIVAPTRQLSLTDHSSASSAWNED